MAFPETPAYSYATYIEEMYAEHLADGILDHLPVYETLDAKTFVVEFTLAGEDIEHYHGRSWYQGPSVTGDDLQDLIRGTSVRVRWDSMGLGYVLHPATTDAGNTQERNS